jgi:uncharacterized protein (TIGR00730 family)
MSESSPIQSVCVFCGSSNAADPDYIAAAGAFGKLLAQAELKLVYGGGGIGLMGAVARGAFEAGGKVLGVMPEFLRLREVLFDEIETVIVPSMHERKMMMFERSDAFVILPGGVGTLEEVIELMSWRRLSLHAKPIVFFDQGGYWQPLFDLLQHTVDHRLTPAEFLDTYRSVTELADIIPAIQEMAAEAVKPIGLVI